MHGLVRQNGLYACLLCTQYFPTGQADKQQTSPHPATLRTEGMAAEANLILKKCLLPYQAEMDALDHRLRQLLEEAYGHLLPCLNSKNEVEKLEDVKTSALWTRCSSACDPEVDLSLAVREQGHIDRLRQLRVESDKLWTDRKHHQNNYLRHVIKPLATKSKRTEVRAKLYALVNSVAAMAPHAPSISRPISPLVAALVRTCSWNSSRRSGEALP
jgi:hypothetical protein